MWSETTVRETRNCKRRHRQDKHRDPLKNPLLVRRAERRVRTIARRRAMQCKELKDDCGEDPSVTALTVWRPPDDDPFVLIELPPRQGVLARLWAWLRGR